MEKYFKEFPPVQEVKFVADKLKSMTFDPVKCGLYSGNYRFCFQTERGKEFITELDVCAKQAGPFASAAGHRDRLLREAFRNAIHDQILEVKKRHFATKPVQICPITLEHYSFDTCHVDHGGKTSALDTSLSFEALLRAFLNVYSLETDMVYSVYAQKRPDARINEFARTIELSTTVPYEIKNEKIKKAWQEYHKIYAVLHVVSRRANLFMQDLRRTEDIKDTENSDKASVQPKRKRQKRK